MKLSDFEMIIFKLEKLGYPVKEMTVADVQEMTNKFLGGQKNDI